MKKIKTASLTGDALDWAVAKCEGHELTEEFLCGHSCYPSGLWMPSSDWSQGGPIIEREFIAIFSIETRPFEGEWAAQTCRHSQTEMDEMGTDHYAFYCPPEAIGETPLIAAMRCYVASKLGNEVEVSEELINEKICLQKPAIQRL